MLPADTASAPVHTTQVRGLDKIHTGKVRDIYAIDADSMLIVTTDRLSAFDVVLPDPIPDKGRVRLLRRYRRGHAAIDGYAEDYAFLIFGLLELFEASGDGHWLDWSVALQDRMDETFWDEQGGGWFSTTGRDRSVLLRLKEDHDGAEPSPTAVGALNLLRLAHLTGEARYETRARRAVGSFATQLSQYGRGVPMMASALATLLTPASQIVIVGEPDAADTRALHAVVERQYRPFTLVVPVAPGERQATLKSRLPWMAAMTQVGGRATAYVCRDFACEAPIADATTLERHLASAVRA